MDDYEFCGGKLHVCYVPEYETVEETRAKLEDRRQAVARRIRQLAGKGRTALLFLLLLSSFLVSLNGLFSRITPESHQVLWK